MSKWLECLNFKNSVFGGGQPNPELPTAPAVTKRRLAIPVDTRILPEVSLGEGSVCLSRPLLASAAGAPTGFPLTLRPNADYCWPSALAPPSRDDANVPCHP